MIRVADDIDIGLFLERRSRFKFLKWWSSILSCKCGFLQQNTPGYVVLEGGLQGRYAKGIYAVSVSGRLRKGIVRELKSRGITYRSRDTSTV
ncbi:hypothetical protein TNCV_844201 [Trichonephila clavipes]|nr:hypothetical protein TNCV_844201 [Trichonephila clavipes]